MKFSDSLRSSTAKQTCGFDYIKYEDTEKKQFTVSSKLISVKRLPFYIFSARYVFAFKSFIPTILESANKLDFSDQQPFDVLFKHENPVWCNLGINPYHLYNGSVSSTDGINISL